MNETAKARVVYQADISDFEAKTKKVSETWKDINAQFESAAAAKIGASARESAGGGGGGGAALAVGAAAAAASPLIASNMGKSIKNELRAVGTSNFAQGNSQMKIMRETVAELNELVQQGMPNSLKEWTDALGKGAGILARATRRIAESGVDAFRETSRISQTQQAAAARWSAQFAARNNQRRQTAGAAVRAGFQGTDNEWDRVAGNQHRNARGQFQSPAADSDLTAAELEIRRAWQASQQATGKIEKLGLVAVKALGLAAKSAQALTIGIVAIAPAALTAISGVGAGIGKLARGIMGVKRFFGGVAHAAVQFGKAMPFSVWIGGAVMFGGPLAALGVKMLGMVKASIAAKGALAALLRLPTGALLGGITAIWRRLHGYKSYLKDAGDDPKTRSGVFGMLAPKGGNAAKAAGGGAAGGGGGMGMLSPGMLAMGGVAAPIAAVGAGLTKALATSINFNESANRMGEIFRSAEPQAVAFVDSLAESYGTNKREATDAMSTFGQLFEKMGGSSQEVSEMSQKFVKLAMDASSFHNVSLDSAIEKMGAAFRGEADPIEAFGVDVKENAVKMEGLRMGLIRTGQEMTETQKMQARASIMMRQMSNAAGDMDRNMDSPANTIRRLQGATENLLLSIGKEMQPAFEVGVTAAADFVQWLGKKFDENRATFKVWVDYVKYGINLAKSLFSHLPVVWEIVQVRASTIFQNVQKVLWWFWDIAKTVAMGIWNDFPGLIKEAFMNVVAIAQNLIHNVQGIFSGGWEAIGRTFTLIFDKVVKSIDDMTGGLVGKILNVKTKDQLENEWKDLQQKFDLKNLTDGTSLDHFNKLKQAVQAIPMPEFADDSGQIAALKSKLTETIQESATEAAKAEEKKQRDFAAKAPPKEEIAMPEAPTKEIKASIKSAEDYSRSFSENLLGKEKEDKKQTEYQKQIAEATREQAVIARRREARAPATVRAD